MGQDKCTHPEESIHMLEGYLCKKCGHISVLLRCMRCNMWFSQCMENTEINLESASGICNNGERVAWE